MNEKERLDEILARLKDEYPEADTTLDYVTPYQLLVATVLSAQCTDERVNSVTPALFDEFPTPEAMAEALQEHVAELVKSTGYYNSKSEYLVEGAKTLVEEFDGEVPHSIDELTRVEGVGRKTANVVVSNAFGTHEGVAVDTHVQRLSQRLGLVETENRDEIERVLREKVPREDWGLVSHLLIAHGRAVCTARSPDCGACVLEDICPSSRV
ncbi:MAG: endonuclease III [Halobacteriales archaeon]|nr:endonuclease III [Halobacteriales archaeon]